MKKKNIILASLLLVLVFFVGCEQISTLQEIDIAQGLESKLLLGGIATQQIVEFEDFDEAKNFIEASMLLGQSGSRSSADIMMKSLAAPMMAVESMAMDGAVAESIQNAPSAGGAEDYSQTNVQVKGVDEADFIKNDDKYIYILADNKLVIIDAFAQEILSETEFDVEGDDYYGSGAVQLFLYQDKLLVFYETNEKSYFFQKYDIMPRQTYKPKTNAYLYDISDREKPVLEEEFELPGRYFQSRMISGVVYVVSQEGVHDGYGVVEPIIYQGDLVVRPKIFYFDNPESSYQYNTVTSIDIDSEEVVDSKSFMLGYSNTLMVSQDNIYISYQKQSRWRSWMRYDTGYDKGRFYDVILPLLEGDLKSDIQSVIGKGLDEDEEWAEISDVLNTFFRLAEKNDDVQEEYEDMFEDIQEALEEYDTKKVLEERKTIIQKISISDGVIEHAAQGEVYGSLLNQFSLDEYDGNLRVATTVSVWTNKRTQYNNVYVLDSEMEVIGELEKIAEDERIFSTRFMGDKLFMVTFRQTDPFFVIDLSNPEKPEVLGELKLPGFSDYLHPYDENHIIGIGKETEENKWGGVNVQGVKIALFDVSDYENPKLVDSVEIGDRGSSSAVLDDHKAFLFSKDRNLLVLPVTVVTDRETISEYLNSNSIWYGAYVYKIDEDGFEELGRIKHDSTKSNYYPWWSESTVRRSLYLDDNLYTVSSKLIKVNDLGNDLEDLGEVELPYTQNRPRYY
ncbi:hypothetical protein GOV05_03355 [Candidatus Woesearchaeota archaeon]|nr:hypothetical protein [Candidatus Woesearchaeota archaeon]